MTTLTTRQKLITYLADADEKEVDAVYNFLKADLKSDSTFTLDKDQLAMLEQNKEAHISGKTKSYSRKEGMEIIKGTRDF